MIRVLLADDQPLVRTGFRMILDSEPGIEVVGEACDGADAVRQAGQLRPDVVVMDIRMPVQDGISATSALAPETKVLVLTETTVKTHVHHLLAKVGARDRVQLVIYAYEAGLTGPS